MRVMDQCGSAQSVERSEETRLMAHSTKSEKRGITAIRLMLTGTRRSELPGLLGFSLAQIKRDIKQGMKRLKEFSGDSAAA